ncbi:MAG: hypothetical protein QOJ15_8243 [Bradyrhizobium sp.]|jgi:hypothetical protein|nr:hypothetical protein [Bradyrhizobium sp.]
MYRFLSLFLLGLVALCAQSSLAAAQSIPDLKGAWSGKGKAIVSGDSRHHTAAMPSAPANNHRLTELTFNLTIEGQQDSRFWGTVGSQTMSEPFIGIIAPDGKRIRISLMNGGVYDGLMLDNNSIEFLYTESKAGAAVVASIVHTRQKQ